MADGLVIPGPEEEFERKQDFEKPTFSLDGSSLGIRPDSISFDHHIAYSLGPVALSDTSRGAVFMPWRIRFDKETGEFFIQPNGGSEIFLFSTNEQDVREVDLAFTQNADPVVCAQVGDDIWLYWFDPQVNDFVFVELGPGRNPRIALDNPEDIPSSDVLLFYVSDAQDALVYRIQRERYEQEHTTPVVGVSDIFVEEVYKSDANRLHVLYSERDPATGRYAIKQLNSKLLPFKLPPENLNVAVEVVLVDITKLFNLIDVILSAGELDIDVEIVGAVLADLIIFVDLLEEISITTEVVSISVPVVLINSFIEEELVPTVEVVSAVLNIIVIEPNIDAEELDVSVEVISATLETP